MISILDTLTLLWPFSTESDGSTAVRMPVLAVQVWHRRPIIVNVNGVTTMVANPPRPVRTTFTKDVGCRVIALLLDPELPLAAGEMGTPITQADIGTITVTVTADGDAVAGYDGLSLDAADVVLDEVQDIGDPRVDGVNFEWNMPGDAFPTADVLASVVITVTHADGIKTWLIELTGPVREAGTW